MAVQEKRYTSEDLWEMVHLPENAGKRFELIEGVIYEMSPTGWLHGDIAFELGRLIGNYVKQHKLGRVTAAETGYTLSPGTTLAPDVGFVAAARVPEQLPAQFVPFAPDLAVEVISPGNSATEIRGKIEQYLKYGTRLVWVVYPDQEKIDIYRPAESGNATVQFVDIDGALDGGDVLPGFKLTVRDLFSA